LRGTDAVLRDSADDYLFLSANGPQGRMLRHRKSLKARSAFSAYRM